MSWCFQCGELGTPEKATGVDDDGEPACALHAKREPRKFDSKFVEQRLKQFHGNESEAEMAKGDPCACGCGELVKGNRHTYVRGHKPKHDATEEPEVSEPTTTEPVVHLTLPVSKVEKLVAFLLQ